MWHWAVPPPNRRPQMPHMLRFGATFSYIPVSSPSISSPSLPTLFPYVSPLTFYLYSLPIYSESFMMITLAIFLQAFWCQVNKNYAKKFSGFVFQFRLESAELIVWLTDVCLSSNFQIATVLLLQFLFNFYESWRTWSMCQYEKNCATDFRNCALKIFGKFFKFYVEVSGLIGLL